MDKKELMKLILDFITKAEGKKSLKYMDVVHEIKKTHNIDKKEIQMAVKELVDTEQLVYEYRGGSYLVLPKVDKASINM